MLVIHSTSIDKRTCLDINSNLQSSFFQTEDSVITSSRTIIKTQSIWTKHNTRQRHSNKAKIDAPRMQYASTKQHDELHAAILKREKFLTV